MPSKFEELVQLCVSQAEDLRRFVEELPLSEWNTPSACGEWQVGEVMAHLNHSAHLFSRLIPGMVSGVTPEGETWRVPNPDRQEEVAGAAKDERGEIGDGELRRQLLEGTAKFIDALRPLKPEDADKTSDAAMGGRRTLYQVLGVRVGEIVIHRWDMESRVKPDAHMATEALPTLMGYLAGWRMFSFQKATPRPPVHYRWRVTVPAPVDWDLVIRGDSFEHIRGSAEKPDVTFTTDAETYSLIGVGRLDLGRMIEEGRVKAEGSAEGIEAYAGYFPNL